MHLIDVNVWLALIFQSHVHHASAKAWMRDAAPTSCFFCRVTQLAFLRLSTNPKVFPGEALTMRVAWELYDRTLTDIRVAYVEEPPMLEEAFRRMTQSQQRSHKAWTDAYLAAFAWAGNFELVTFDRGFSAFGQLRHVILS